MNYVPLYPKHLSDSRSEVTLLGGNRKTLKKSKKPGFPHRNQPYGIVLQPSRSSNSHQLGDYLIGVIYSVMQYNSIRVEPGSVLLTIIFSMPETKKVLKKRCIELISVKNT